MKEVKSSKVSSVARAADLFAPLHGEANPSAAEA